MKNEDKYIHASLLVPQYNGKFKLQVVLNSIRTAEELEKTGEIVKLTLNLKEDHLFKEVYYTEKLEPTGELTMYVWPTKEGMLGKKDGYIRWICYPKKFDLMKVRREMLDEYEQELLENASYWTIQETTDDYENDIRTIIF